MIRDDNLLTLVPHKMPASYVERTLLFAIRCLAAGGLNDASAANLLLGKFGLGHRRPLMLLRILMAEVSRISQRQIAIAPCCCLRMTEGEATFMSVIAIARSRPTEARARIARMAGTLDCLSVVSVAQALGDALDDIGRPLQSLKNCDSFA